MVADPMLHGHGALHSFSALFGLHTTSRKPVNPVQTMQSLPAHLLSVPDLMLLLAFIAAHTRVYQPVLCGICRM